MKRLLIVIGLLWLAFWLRLENLDTFPPGLSSDEAVDVVDAFHISRTGNYPLYEDPNRPEPLFRAVQAAGALLFGPGVWAFRLTSVFVGVLTVAAAFWAARECVHDLPPAARSLAGFGAAASLAVGLSHVVLTRSLYRAVPQPLFMLLFVGFLLRGLRARHLRAGRRDLILSGVSLAAALYTYTAALALPVAFAPLALSLLLFRHKQWRLWLPRLLWAGLVCAVLIAPVGLRLLADPEAVIGRAAAVSQEGSKSLGERVAGLIGQFFVEGDMNPQYNAESAPLLPPVFNALFAVGLLGLLSRFRQPSSALVAALLILAAIPVLATEEVPHGLRVMGEFAVFPLVIGVGVAAVVLLVNLLTTEITEDTEVFKNFSVISVRSVVKKSRVVYTGVFVLLGAVTLADALAARQTYVAYWSQPYTWQVYGTELGHGEWFFRPDRRDFARWLAAQSGPLLVPLDELNAPTTRVWLLTAYPDVRTAGDDVQIPAGARLVVPWALESGDLQRETRSYGLLQDGAITLLPLFSAETHAALLAGIDRAQAITRENGDLLARVAPLPEGMEIAFEPRALAGTDSRPLATFGEEAALLGWRGPDTLPGRDAQTVTVTLDWSALRRLGHEYSAFVQLQTQGYESLAGSDVRIWRWLFPSTIWRAGSDVIPDAHTLAIPADLEPGAYRLMAGLYTFLGERVPVAAGAAGSLPDAAMLGWIKVPQREMPPPDQGVLAVDAALADTFALRGASAFLQPDGRIRVTLYWESRVERPDLDATIFVHVVDEDGELVAQDDRRPWDGQYPTFIWGAGERVQTDHLLDIEGAATGDLRLLVGMYTLPGVERLPVIQNGAPVQDGRVPLGVFASLMAE